MAACIVMTQNAPQLNIEQKGKKTAEKATVEFSLKRRMKMNNTNFVARQNVLLELCDEDKNWQSEDFQKVKRSC